VLVSILLIAKYAKGFVANISVLLGIIIGGVIATMPWADELRQSSQGGLV
jgi:xanthine/uracil permease